MQIVWILAGVLAFAALAVVVISYLCFRKGFYVTNAQKQSHGEFPVPEGEIYEPFREKMIHWMKDVRSLPHEDMEVTSFDGLTLRGKYYEFAPGAPIELMFHGYRGSAERDLCGGVQRCFKLGHSALIVSQRGSGGSDGRVISFGINESRDCHTWLAHMLTRFGPEVRILLTGISMGAATVLIAAGRELPKNVVGVLADCGYSSAREIIHKTIREMGLPVGPSYPFVKLGARLFGGFALEEQTPLEAVTRCPVPVIFFHGEDDDFVPCDMSRRMYEACKAPRKRLVTVPGAGHGLSYPVDPQGYLKAMREFFDEEK